MEIFYVLPVVILWNVVCFIHSQDPATWTSRISNAQQHHVASAAVLGKADRERRRSPTYSQSCGGGGIKVSIWGAEISRFTFCGYC